MRFEKLCKDWTKEALIIKGYYINNGLLYEVTQFGKLFLSNGKQIEPTEIIPKNEAIARYPEFFL